MRRLLLAALAAMSLVLPASGHGYKAGTIEIVHPFLRATPPGARTGAGYLVIRNEGSEPDRLVGIETEAAERVTFHRTVTENDVARMVPLEAIEIPAGGEYRLGLDGTHAMLEGLTAPIGLGQLIPGTLVFEKAGRIDMEFEVEPAGTSQEDAMQAHGH